MNRTTSAVITAAALLSAAPLEAQVPSTPRALGMGGAYTAVARGQEALFLSPANLGLADNQKWSFALGQFALGGTLVGPSVDDLPDLVQFDDLEDARRDELLASIPTGGAEGIVDVRAPLAALSIGPVALGVSYGAVGSHSVGRDIVELFLEGFDEDRTDYAVGNTVGTRADFWDVALGYGRRVGPVSLGVTGHYLKGGTLMRSRLFEPRIDVEAENIEIDYVAVYARGGNGYSVDVGAAYQPTPAFTLTGTIANAAANMTWSEDLRVRDFTIDRELIDEGEADDLLTEYEESETELDPNGVSFNVYEAAQGLYDEAFLPATARVGAAYAGRFGTHVAASYEKQLTEGRLGSPWEQQLSVGVQQRVFVFGVRAGYSTNLDGSVLYAGGLNIGPLDLGVGQVRGETVEGTESAGVVATVGLSVRVGGAK